MTRLEKSRQLISKGDKERRNNYFCSKLFLANIPIMVKYFEQFTKNGFLDWYYERLWLTHFGDVPILYHLKLSKKPLVFWCFQGVWKGNIGKKQVKLFNSFQPTAPLLYPRESEKTLGLLLFPGGIKSEYWEEMGEIMSSFILIFTQLKNSFFQGATFINCFLVFKWIARESLLYRVHCVQRQAGIGVQINNQQTQGV